MNVFRALFLGQHEAADRASVDEIVKRALFGESSVRAASRRLVRRRAAKAGITLSTLHALYAARAKGEVEGFTVPALNSRGMGYEFIRAIIRAAMGHRVGPFIIELARSEMGYTEQQPDELVTIALAAALREGYRGPLVIQGDHFQVQPAAPREEEVAALEQLIDMTLVSGMNHIDIDGSKTVDLSLPTTAKQQYENARITAHLTRYIRERQTVPVTIGGEIGEIGGKVSTVEELRAFMDAYHDLLPSHLEGLNKVAIQTGTSHGGTPNEDGTIAYASVDFDALRTLSKMARSDYGMAGAVQHGASTLSEDQFGRFPEVGTAEIHLSTEFQNIIFSHPSFPRTLLQEIDDFLVARFAALRKPGQTDQQFIYTQRKRAWGPFKQRIADLPAGVKDDIGHALEEKVGRLFAALHVDNTAHLMETYHD